MGRKPQLVVTKPLLGLGGALDPAALKGDGGGSLGDRLSLHLSTSQTWGRSEQGSPKARSTSGYNSDK